MNTTLNARYRFFLATNGAGLVTRFSCAIPDTPGSRVSSVRTSNVATEHTLAQHTAATRSAASSGKACSGSTG